MRVCTFFGHRECPEAVKEALYLTVEKLIGQGVDTFYVGNQGQFDAYVRGTLRRLSVVYPHIRYNVVLAYLPEKPNPAEDYTDTIFPEGLETVLPRFAIDHRNRWMLRQAELVICYTPYPWGGAYKFAQQARKQKKVVIALEI